MGLEGAWWMDWYHFERYDPRADRVILSSPVVPETKHKNGVICMRMT